MPEPIILSKQVKQDLKGVVALMEANIDRIDMNNWLYKRSKAETPKGTSCGTVGCIAGYINLYHGYKEKFFEDNKYWANLKIPAKATKIEEGLEPTWASEALVAAALMGLGNKARVDVLYYVDEWPQPFKSKYKALENENGDIADGNHKKAGEVTISRLKYFIKTGL